MRDRPSPHKMCDRTPYIPFRIALPTQKRSPFSRHKSDRPSPNTKAIALSQRKSDPTPVKKAIALLPTQKRSHFCLHKSDKGQLNLCESWRNPG
ncbi:MAG: hypothetical protein JGK03_14830 [Microcoleus sp. PH2017_25_DOB_D_A]|uniref:hypothetical protein n=1 Tax=unclassified Microcoleus TaxID=2642155 RepID=UPI001D1F8B63|nr:MULTISPECIES: hypothetical protein [unclassified Microcoleus]MCC3490636.1 hypothetical protein [Microcoleus sp. PH2017_16_JOR_D_A]MCC3535451.1 hypothetical protein [Microcoleus sp. PH2017_25_DOB_D_A]MCC3547613.1 hypothetical protein [Microcoleus sp. PH2017_24_DOB_U_A]